jgi:hypothetical protein
LDVGLDPRRKAVNWFLESYLVEQGLPSDPESRFRPNANLPDLLGFIEMKLKSAMKSSRNNNIVEFIDWVIVKDFSEPNDHGQLIPLVLNPFSKVIEKRSRIESVWNALPYKYIKELRSILCPNSDGNYCDWLWAHQQTGQSNKGRSSGDWFEVDQSCIDEDDPDCIWRERKLLSGQTITINGKKIKLTENLSIFEIWSPVRAMVLFMKLNLPLRTYQVRMLDSGEADTWRYINGQWKVNTNHSFVVGNKKSPRQRGVFRRIRSLDTGDYHAGFYINTNKTADQNKDVEDRGYIIPWQNEIVLYWLEKLRNWQEKYNPVDEPTLWESLKTKHLGNQKSQSDLKRMGSTCFLFRDASAVKTEDRIKPVRDCSESLLWYQLLNTLEDRLFKRGETLSDGSRLRLVNVNEDNYKSTQATEFPLHSLRVSLLTHFAMDGQVPLPVLSKLLAGHSRIIMTLYYIKITPTQMRAKMWEAESKLDSKEDENLKHFLTNTELSQIYSKTVYNDQNSIKAVLVNRNPVGWEERHIGLCLAGGNNVTSDEKGTQAGCWNGGELITTRGEGRPIYGPVPHGPENCIRCRWFITDAKYLDALRAQFNNLSYRAQLSANLAVELEQKVEVLEDTRYAAEISGHPFTLGTELQQVQRRYDKQLVDADEYAKDIRACFTLIHRIIDVELNRQEDDSKNKLVAVGTLSDINQPISLLETNSELLQLSGVCEDAEIYPEQADELLKTPAIEKRSRTLNTVLMREGYQPIFMTMDESMQLIMGNALMRAMAQQAHPVDWKVEGMQKVCGLIDAERSLRESGILEKGVEALESQWQKPVLKLRELLQPNKTELICAND